MSSGAKVTHAGYVAFENGQYLRKSGTENWRVAPIPGFKPPIRLPLGQVEIRLDEPAEGPYAVVVTAERTKASPLASANYGDVTREGFVVHLWETVADRTLANCGFSFLVVQTD